MCDYITREIPLQTADELVVAAVKEWNKSPRDTINALNISMHSVNVKEVMQTNSECTTKFVVGFTTSFLLFLIH